MIICLTGIPGAGKSAILGALQETLPSWKTLRFDDYDYSGPKYRELCAGTFEWSEVLCPELARDVLHQVELGVNVLIEDPRGKVSRDIGAHIDLQIAINCPAHIAVARKALEINKRLDWKSASGFLSSYLAGGHRAVKVYENQVLPLSDLEIDGTDSIEIVVSKIKKVCEKGLR